MTQSQPQDRVFWYQKPPTPKKLRGTITTDIAVIGGGMAGLSTAQSFRERGCNVVLIEKDFCGAGATGKSSGFITPDSEYGLAHFAKIFGPQKAKEVWQFVSSGDQLIKTNIEKHTLPCDYKPQDTLIVANSRGGFSNIKAEYQVQQQLFSKGQLYNESELQHVIGSKTFFGGVRYAETFGINPYLYCQEMKQVLERSGVSIFEETPAISFGNHHIQTPDGTIKADHIIVCLDRYVTDLHKLMCDIYHVQTFITVSAPLKDSEVKSIFPETPLMVWDTDLIYHYYRIIDGNRFLIGGSDLFSTFWGYERHNAHNVFKMLSNYARKKFPQISFTFEYMWPGLIGVSKDIMAIADYDRQDASVYYIAGVAGLPWAAALGNYSAEKILDKRSDLDEYFSLNRAFPIGGIVQKILGNRITFALSNFISLYLR